MKLSLEVNNQRETLEVYPLDRELPLSPEVSGVRVLNRIRLRKKSFSDFILALTIDDFEAVRDIFGQVVDLNSNELTFKSPITNIRILTYDQDNPEEMKALF